MFESQGVKSDSRLFTIDDQLWQVHMDKGGISVYSLKRASEDGSSVYSLKPPYRKTIANTPPGRVISVAQLNKDIVVVATSDGLYTARPDCEC